MGKGTIIKAAAGLAAIATGSVAGVCVARALSMKPARPQGSPLDAGGYRAGDDAVERFRELLRIPTVSRDDPELVDREPFERRMRRLQRL